MLDRLTYAPLGARALSTAPCRLIQSRHDEALFHQEHCCAVPSIAGARLVIEPRPRRCRSNGQDRGLS